MTAGITVRHLSGIAKGLSGWRQTHSGPRRHSSEGSPAWMQVVEPRLEQAAEESRRGGRGVQGWQGLSGAHVRLSLLLSFPLSGNGLYTPLDSGLRRNDEMLVVIPAIIPVKAGIQERGPGGAGMAGFIGCPCPIVVTIVIPAKREWLVNPLDSGLRRNDEMLVVTPSSFQRKLESSDF